MNWKTMLQAWGLGSPDDRRVQRARDDVLSTVVAATGATTSDIRTFSANFKHTVTLRRAGPVRCSCQDFTTRQMHHGLACKHLVAVAMWLEDRGLTTDDLFADSANSSSPSSASASPGWPANAIRAAVGQAIQHMTERIGATLMEGESPLLIGPTGVGKTSAAHQVAEILGLGLEETVGSDSWTEADLIGCWTPAREWAWGPIGRAFRRAREGESVLVFVDEVTRFNPRAMDLLLRAIQPLSSRLARRMGIAVTDDTEAVYVAEAPLLGHRDWAPAANLTWVAAGNPGVQPLDPALVRRFLVLEVSLQRAVLEVLPDDVQPLVAQLWDSYERGELPLPLEYQQLARARGADDLFQQYHTRLRALDPIAAEAVARILSGNGVTVLDAVWTPATV